MTKPLEYELILTEELDALANTVKKYILNGWVPKGEVIQYKGNFGQEMQRSPIETKREKKAAKKKQNWMALHSN